MKRRVRPISDIFVQIFFYVVVPVLMGGTLSTGIAIGFHLNIIIFLSLTTMSVLTTLFLIFYEDFIIRYLV
jgi:hypothetical protein